MIFDIYLSSIYCKIDFIFDSVNDSNFPEIIYKKLYLCICFFLSNCSNYFLNEFSAFLNNKIQHANNAQYEIYAEKLCEIERPSFGLSSASIFSFKFVLRWVLSKVIISY